MTEPKMAPAVKYLFIPRVHGFSSSNIDSMGVIAYINESLCKFELSSYFDDWFVNSRFLFYNEWKSIVNQRINEYENAMWFTYCACHLNMDTARNCLENVSPSQFWSISELCPD